VNPSKRKERYTKENHLNRKGNKKGGGIRGGEWESVVGRTAPRESIQTGIEWFKRKERGEVPDGKRGGGTGGGGGGLERYGGDKEASRGWSRNMKKNELGKGGQSFCYLITRVGIVAERMQLTQNKRNGVRRN